ELHQLATRFGIMHRGHLIEELSAEELNEKCRQHLRIKVNDANLAATILETKLDTSNINILTDGLINLYEFVDNPGNVSTILVNNGLVIEQFTLAGDDLETYYMHLIGGASNE